MKNDEELMELIALQVKALKEITYQLDKLDCLAQMIGTCAKLSRQIVIHFSFSPDKP